MSNGINLVKLHDYPHMLNACVQLLNNEWPRSETARIHSLQQSRDSLPMSLILINENNQLIGHVKLKRDLPNTRTAFIESLIVDKSLRGKGFGKYIMKQIEYLAKELGLEKLVLTTINQIGFYKSLGFLINETPKEVIKSKVSHFNQIKNESNEKSSSFTELILSPTSMSSLPPIPPPMPPNISLNFNNNFSEKTEVQKTLMYKFI